MFSTLGESPYESHTDRWICEQLLERLGYNPSDVYPISEKQAYFNKLATTMLYDEQGESSPLFTITQDDIDKMGVDGKPQEGTVALSEVQEKGVYQVERHFGDGYTYIAYADFIADPEANPVNSKSGKFEICCQSKADKFNMVRLSDEEYKAYPTYHEFLPTEEYPLMMFNTHYPRSACSDFDNVTTLREAFSAPVTINASDAAARGISSGDPILVSSPYGKILRIASVSELIVPGAVDIPNGTWPRFNEEGVDLGGCPNTLYGGDPYGMGVSGYNNVAVQVEKWTGGELEPDYENQLTIDSEE